MSSMSFYETLPGAPDKMLQGCVILVQALGKCVAQSSCDTGFGLDTSYANCIAKLQHSGHPNRQQQQLLQAVVWPLPLFLLQTAARFGPQDALVTRVAAEAAWLCCTCWQAPALLAAAQQQPAAAAAITAAAAAASAGGIAFVATEPQQGSAEQLLLPMLEAWMQLIQQQLLQPPVGLLCIATAARQQQQQQGCSTSFQQTKQLLEGPMCSCCSNLNHKHSGGVCHASISSISSNVPPSCALDCDRLYCLGVLLVLLQPLSYLCNTPGSAAVWSSKLQAVLLVFEVIMRQLLPLAVSCSSSSNSSSSSGGGNSGGEQGTKRSNAVVVLYEMMDDSLFELLDSRKGKQAPLMVALLGPGAAGSTSDTSNGEEQQQQQQLPPKQQQQEQQQEQQSAQQQEQQQQQQCAAELVIQDTSGHDSHQRKAASQRVARVAQLIQHHHQQHLKQQQQLAQLLQLQRQFFSVIASHLKLCRCPGSPAQPYGYVFGCALELVDKVARAQANSLLRSREDHTVASLSEAQAALVPWLGLMGAYLQEAACAIPQQRDGVVAVLNPEAAAGQTAAAAAEGSVEERLTLALRNCNQALDQVLELLNLLEEFVADTWHDTVFENHSSSSSSSSSSGSSSGGAGDDGGAGNSASGSTGSGGGACSSSGGSSGVAAAGSSCSWAENSSSSSSTAVDTTSGSGSTSAAVNATPSSSSSSSSDGDSGAGGSKLKSLWQSFWHPAGHSSSNGKEGGEGLSDMQPVADQDKQQQQQQEDDTAGTAAAAAAADAAAAERSCTPYDGLYAELDTLCDMQIVRDVCESLMWDVMVDDVAQEGPGITAECKALRCFLDETCFDDLAHEAMLLGMDLCRKVPAPWRCNNPDCVNMAGVSELQLIGAKSCVCAGCKVAR